MEWIRPCADEPAIARERTPEGRPQAREQNRLKAKSECRTPGHQPAHTHLRPTLIFGKAPLHQQLLDYGGNSQFGLDRDWTKAVPAISAPSLQVTGAHMPYDATGIFGDERD